MKTLTKIWLGLLGISGVIFMILTLVFLPDSIKNYPVEGPKAIPLVLAMVVLELIVIFGPIFLAAYIAYKIHQRQGGHHEDLFKT
ncbi:MAG: hypothetical protein A2418_03170 [Candidatus Brennerbacteria bacterium RIFOXYC1_FULL_41_11]|uniref:Uncharacterized protein n=1 Tax=Candidatus Brennerbacteria bacterium RIFOXYD1_FULL_41_16 TaxID=1797529 RepID=A0A1G1XKK9_9BACT|nr:MAG: hypothetical protein UU61_C0016G0002 [Parcubacteria group bacterium GW2011_GWB1_41_4]OGY39150.1 MAG: hypothetical protein A2391_00775 [Candidatus Brennerbacteria bacterium RIFOXYB1_FULL_41_13]OGY39832.1 MAG: hypothetical protein A2418_03170 [Candidatus Brennerbacteria bacterium RIFOXYC1_FULL_41_11]OGY40569.1 MAG: hypothetical protein A2570_02430 [Candidatus Brennerbacteria bacterium RIFOXYD1_FULL_41_16]